MKTAFACVDGSTKAVFITLNESIAIAWKKESGKGSYYYTVLLAEKLEDVVYEENGYTHFNYTIKDRE